MDAPDLPQYRMVDVFHSCTDKEIKNYILHNFGQHTSRMVIAMIAFSMGIDCSNVHHISHMGVPEDLEAYIQEIGRAGKDRIQSMKNYVANTKYR